MDENERQPMSKIRMGRRVGVVVTGKDGEEILRIRTLDLGYWTPKKTILDYLENDCDWAVEEIPDVLDEIVIEDGEPRLYTSPNCYVDPGCSKWDEELAARGLVWDPENNEEVNDG